MNRKAQLVLNWKKMIKCNNKAFLLLSVSSNAGCIMIIVNCFSFFFLLMPSLFGVVGLKQFSISFSSGRNLSKEHVLFHCSTSVSFPCTFDFFF